MNKIVKWVCVSGVAVLLLLAAVLLVLPKFISVEKYKPEIENLISESTGRSCAIGEDLSLTLFPWAGISVSGFSLGNPEGFAKPHFVKVKNFEVRVKLLPLLFKDVQVKKLVLSEPEIHLIQGKRNNWTFDLAQGGKAEGQEKRAPEPGKETKVGLKNLHVGELALVNGRVVYQDLGAKTTRELSEINLSLVDISLAKPVQFDFSTRIDGKPLSVTGQFGPMGPDLANESIPLDLKVDAFKEIHGTVSGKLLNRPEKPGADLSVSVSEFSFRKLLVALDMKIPVETADPDTLKKVSLTLKTQADPDSVSVTGGVFKLDDTTVAFSAGVKNFKHPLLSSKIDVDRINLDRYLPPTQAAVTSAGGSKGPAAKGQPVDYAPLRGFDSTVSVTAGEVVAGHVKISRLALDLVSRKGLFDLKNLAFDTYEGRVESSGTFDLRKKKPSVKLRLDGKGIQANPLLVDAAGKDVIEGGMNIGSAIRFSGDQPDEIKKSLNGKGKLMFSDGAVKGVDLSGMVRNVKSALGLEKTSGERPRTDFSELVVPFSIKNGVVTIENGVLSSPFLRLNAGGQTDLVREKLDLRVEPKLVATMKGQGDTATYKGILVPVMIQGSFASPKFRPDLKGMLQGDVGKKLLGSDKIKKLKEDKGAGKVIDAAEGLMDSLFK